MRYFLTIISFLLMGYGLKYRMKFDNREGQLITAKIFDAIADVVNNPYNFQFTEIPVDPMTLEVAFTFNTLPVDVDNVIVGVSSDGGATFGNTNHAPNSPIVMFIPPGTYVYRVTLHHLDDSTDVYDLWTLAAQVIDLTPADNALDEAVVDVDDNKFKVIKAKQVTLRFNSNSNFSMRSFCVEPVEDTRYYAEIDCNGKIFFKGFAILDDMQEPFLSPRNVVELKFTDRLGTLKDIALVKFDDTNPKGKYRIADFLAWMLKQTGLNLPLNVQWNLREEHDYDNNWLDKIYMDAKTFEKEIGTSIDCYSALEYILGHYAFITQEKAEWWLKNEDEFDQQKDHVQIFNSDGSAGGVPIEADHIISIGKNEKVKFINKRTIVNPVRPLKFTKLTYKYQNPLEIVCNIDFSRGDFIADLPDEVIDGINYSAKKFDIECWDKLWSNTVTDDPEPDGIYLKRLYAVPGYEHSRFVVLEHNTIPHFRFIMSEPVQVNAKDKITVDISRRLSSDVGGSGFFRDEVVQLRLYGEDGTFWTHHGKTSVGGDVPKWVACDNIFRSNQKFLCIESDSSYDQTQAVNLFNGECAEVPVGGEVRMLIYQSALYGNTKDTYIDSVTFDVLAYINGSYQKYTGQSNKVTQAGDFFANVDEEIKISDSPHRLFKGALYYKDGDEYKLAGRFFNSIVFPMGPPDESYLHPFSYLQIFSLFNQYNRLQTILRAELFGLGQGELDELNRCNTPGLLHKYKVTDASDMTYQRYFQMLSYTKNWKTCVWTAVLKEVYNISKGKKYDDAWVFRYETS